MFDLNAGHGRSDVGSPKSRRDRGVEDRGFDFACLENLDEITALKDEWRDLEESSIAEMAYFQSYDWCVTWWNTYAADKTGPGAPQLRVYTARRNGSLVMLWPMMLVNAPLGLRKLVPIGSGLAQYGGNLVDRKKVTGGEISRCWKWICQDSGLDLVMVDRVPQSTMLATSLSAGSSYEVCETSIIDLTGVDCRSELSANVKASTRRNRVKRRNRLAGGEKLELIAIHGGSDAYRRAVALGHRWKSDWLRETGRFSDSVGDTRGREFVANLSEGAVALVLKRGGEPVAMEIGFIRGDHFYSYFGAFDWSLKRLSPGRVQIEDALDWMIGKGLKYYDLLGNPSAYKQDMSNLNIALHSFAHPATFKGYVYARIWRHAARPLLKQSFYALSAGSRRRLVEFYSWLKALWAGKAAGGHAGSSEATNENTRQLASR